MNSKIRGRIFNAILTIAVLTLALGCEKKEEAPPTVSGGAGTGLQSRLNDPNISPEIKEKMKAAAQPASGVGTADPAQRGGN